MSVHPPTRQCGRCRLRFAVDADTHPMELGDWWACQTCADSLLPGRQRRAATRAEARPGPT